MSFRLETLTTLVNAAPGETATGRVAIHNDGQVDSIYAIEVVGLGGAPATPVQVSVGAGASAVVDVAFLVPTVLGIGEHAAAFETRSNRPDERPILTPFTLSIASVARVDLVATPSTLRGRRRVRFSLDVTNNEPHPVDLEVSGSAPDVDVEFTPTTVALQPGQRVVTKGTARGPRRWSGEPTQHNLLISARGRAATTNITTPYVQRPVFAHRLRAVLAAFTVIALWLAAIGGVAFWLATRDDGNQQTSQLVGVDTDGDGIVDAFFTEDGMPVTGTDTDGDGIPDSFTDADGNPIPATDTDGDGIPDTIVTSDGDQVEAVDTDGDGQADSLSTGAEPAADQPVAAEQSLTSLRGTVAVDGDPNEITVTLTPLQFGEEPDPAATPIGLRSPPGGKQWSARHGSLAQLAPLAGIRRTTVVEPVVVNPSAEGIWLFTDVVEGQSYELAFKKLGFDTQSFVVSPDGEPLDLDVELEPSDGSLSGRVVDGNGSALGGAEVVITDGTLSFTTTSESGTGAWGIEAISTPGVYTVTSTLRGYATAVSQIELEPDDDASDVVLEMVAGLGTLTGRVVDNAGQPLAGATISASTGDTTVMTSTLTEGDIGFFSLPQLDVPATYTVTAELDGYVTQSRLVRAGGSVGGIDFTMSATTAQLTGRILSSAGGGIESAGITIRTGDLEFRTSTSVAPSAGVFQVDRLPPGAYTLTIEHFRHETITEFVTLEAGSTPPPVEVTLQATSGPPAVGTGSLALTVTDIETAEPIVPTSISVTRIRGTEAFAVLTDLTSSEVVVDDLPVGTYTATVSAAGYNDFTTQPVSIGIGPQERPAPLQRLGQAGGQVLDAVTGARISAPAAVNLFFTDPLGNKFGPAIRTGIPVVDGVWDSGSGDLPIGRYLAELAADPPGYVTTTGERFEIIQITSDGVVAPVLIPDLTVNPYPAIAGSVYSPVLANGGTPSERVDFLAIDSPDLAATATCGGTPVPVAVIDSSTSALPSSLDRFEISGTDIAAAVPAASLPTTCAITVGLDTDDDDAPDSGGAIDPVVATVSGVDVGTAPDQPTDREVAVALVERAASISGEVFWTDPSDGSRRVPEGGVTVATTDEVIIGFSPAESIGVAPPLPSIDVGVVTGASDAGSWSVPGHVFGTATYAFNASGFQPGELPVEIDEVGRNVATGTQTGAVITATGNSTFDVELRPPEPGFLLVGTVDVQSNNPSSPFPADYVVDATAPGSPSAQPLATSGASRQYSVSQPAAGTWRFDFPEVDNHVRTTPASVTQLVQPGQTGIRNLPPTTYVELGTVEVRLVAGTTPITDANVRIGLQPVAPNTETVPATPVTATDDAYVLPGIPVPLTGTSSPEFAYELSLEVENYEVKNIPIPVFPFSAPATAVPVSFGPGDVVRITAQVEAFGSITGSIEGARPDTTGNVPLSILDDTATGFTAGLVVDREGEDGVTVTRDAGGTPGGFSITGPDGLYRITVSHPQYETDPAVTPPDTVDGTIGVTPGGLLQPGTYRIRNNTLNGLDPHVLDLRDGTISITAKRALSETAEVDEAAFRAIPGSTCPTDLGDSAAYTPIPATGPAAKLTPGTYCVIVQQFDGAAVNGVYPAALDPLAFPALAIVTVPPSTQTDPGEATLVVPIPLIAPTINGTLVATNTLTPADPVDLVATSIAVNYTFTTPNDVLIDGTAIANIQPAPNSSVDATTATGTRDEQIWEFSITGLPAGTYTISAPTIPGYTLTNGTQTMIPISSTGPNPIAPFVYTAATSNVSIPIGTNEFPSLDPDYPDTVTNATRPTLTVTGSSPAIRYSGFTFQENATTGAKTLVINNVAPDARGFTLTFDDALHAPVAQGVTVPTPAPATGPRAGSAVAPVGDRVRLTGLAELRTAGNPAEAPTSGQTTALDGSSLLRLTNGGTDLQIDPDGTISSGAALNDRVYRFDVAAATYDLTLTRDDYDTRTISGIALTSGQLGQVVTRDIRANRFATVAVSVSTGGLDAPAGLQVQLVGSSTKDPRTGTSAPYLFDDVPAGEWRARATATGYPDQTSALTTIAIGSDNTGSPISLVLPRIVRANVSLNGTGSGVIDILEGTTVRASAAVTGGVVEFTSTANSNAIPSTGPLTLRASAPGFRTQTVDLGTTLFAAPASITLQPNVTVNGSVTGATTGTVTASASGTCPSATNTPVACTASAPVASDGTYALSLGVGVDGESKVWTLSYSQNFVGVAPAVTLSSITSTSTSPVNAAALVPAPRDVDYRFRVVDGSGNVSGARVEVLDAGGAVIASNTTAANGQTTVAVPENASPATWRVWKSGFLTRSGTARPMNSLDPTPRATIRLVDTVSGTTAGVSGTGSATAAIRVCPPTFASTPCTGGQAITTTTASGNAFTIGAEVPPAAAVAVEIPAGPYKVWAIGTGAQGVADLTITYGTTNTAVLSPSTITLTSP